jgi:hypothetical protein
MPNYNEQMQNIWKKYEEAGMPIPAQPRDVAAWAIQNKLWEPKKADVISRCAEDLSKALREEYRVDKKGRRYRAKHAVRVYESGIQYTLWADIDSAPRSHMEKAFAQRRKQVVGDCYQLKTDVDYYNDAYSSDNPIQIVLDFTQDIEELQHVEAIET